MDNKNQNNLNKAKLIRKVTDEMANLSPEERNELNNCALKNMLLISVIRNSLKNNK
jgi:hypothetical protein